MLLSFLFNIIKAIFGYSKQPNLTAREEQIFNKTLELTNKSDMLERIDYWIEKGNLDEAKKLSIHYVINNGEDENILKRKSILKI